MKLGSLNIQRSFYKKYDEIEKFINDEKLDIVGLSEIDIDQGDFIPSMGKFVCEFDHGKKHRLLVHGVCQEEHPV